MPIASEAIVLTSHGAADRLQLAPIAVADPGLGQVRLRQISAGVNFHDIYVRSGAYKTLPLPGVPGLEAVGRVEAIGADVTDIAVGAIVAYIDRSYGGYTRDRVVDAARVVAVPEALDPALVAGWYLKGLTAQALVDEVHPIKPGAWALIHAAGGGVGQVLTQMAKRRGATVIGTAGSEAKAAIARAAGCDHVIAYRDVDVAAAVLDLTGGVGVEVAYDAVGAATFDGSLASLASRGHLVSYGQASGPVPPLDIARLGARSLSVTRPFLWAYIATRPVLTAASARLFAAMNSGDVILPAPQEVALADAALAHVALEERAAGPFVLRC